MIVLDFGSALVIIISTIRHGRWLKNVPQVDSLSLPHIFQCSSHSVNVGSPVDGKDLEVGFLEIQFGLGILPIPLFNDAVFRAQFSTFPVVESRSISCFGIYSYFPRK